MCSGKPSGVFAPKYLILISISDQNGVLLSNEEDILGRWKEYFENLLNPVTITPPGSRTSYIWGRKFFWGINSF